MGVGNNPSGNYANPYGFDNRALAVGMPIHHTPLLSPFQLPVSIKPLKVLFLKIPMEGSQLAFQNFTTSWRLCIWHRRSGDHKRLEHDDFDSTLLISLYCNLPTLYLVFNLGWLPATCHGGLPVWVGTLSHAECIFLIVISPSYPVPPPLPCWGLAELLCPRTT